MKARAGAHVLENWRHRRRSAASRCALLALLVVVGLQILAPTAYALEFGDVPTDHAYALAISDLASRGVISGLPDGSFRPEEPINRQQFAKMIVKTLSIPVTAAETMPFVDIPRDLDSADPLYPDRYLAVFYELGLTKADGADTLTPNEKITYQELLDIITRAADLVDPPGTYAPPFAASQFASSEFYLNARKACYAGLLNGLPKMGASFDFLGSASRGESAQLLYNLLLFMQPPQEKIASSPLEHSEAATQQQELANNTPTAVAVTVGDLAKAARTFRHPYFVVGACVAILVVSAVVFFIIRRRRHHTKQSQDTAVGTVGTNEQARAILEKWAQEQATTSSSSRNPGGHAEDDTPPLGGPTAPTSISLASSFDRLLEKAEKS